MTRSGTSKKFRSRGKFAPAVFVLLIGLGPGITLADGRHVSEALRLWKFTFHMEAAAYGVQYMSQDLLRSAGRQLETAAGHTVIATSAARTCLSAATELADYFDAAANKEGAGKRKAIRTRYETARAGCMRALSANPDEYPLGWPEEK